MVYSVLEMLGKSHPKSENKFFTLSNTPLIIGYKDIRALFLWLRQTIEDAILNIITSIKLACKN